MSDHTCGLEHHGGVQGLSRVTIDPLSRNFNFQYEDGTVVFGLLSECGTAAVVDKVWENVVRAFEPRPAQSD